MLRFGVLGTLTPPATVQKIHLYDAQIKTQLSKKIIWFRLNCPKYSLLDLYMMLTFRLNCPKDSLIDNSDSTVQKTHLYAQIKTHCPNCKYVKLQSILMLK